MRGFSLVELSIVLVILGLLVGGILAGRSLIRASELRAVSTEYQRFLTASHAFRDKYLGIPGDIRDATRFWGRQNSNADCVTNSSASVVASGICDGNGNGHIEFGSASQAGENYQFWRHLSAAGLLESSYSGIAPSSTDYCVIGTDCPASKLAGGGWTMRYRGTFAGDAWNYAMSYGNLLAMGARNGTTNLLNPVLSPEEAWNIDTKIDDGKPASGRMVVLFWNDSCAAADDGSHAYDDLRASYKLSDSAVRCAIYFRQFI